MNFSSIKRINPKVIYKNKKILAAVIVAVIVLSIIISVILGGNKKAGYDIVLAKRDNIVQEVSVTGQIKPIDSVDLAFEKPGKVLQSNFKVGDSVEKGDIVVILENFDISAQLKQAEASLVIEQANLQEMRKGTRPEELQIARSSVDAAYSDVVAAMQKAVSTAKSALITLSDIQMAYFNLVNDSQSINISFAKEDAISVLFDVHGDTGRWPSSRIVELNSGLYGEIQTIKNENNGNIETAAEKIIDVLGKVKGALNTLVIYDHFTATDKANIGTAKSGIDSEIVNISSKNGALESAKESLNLKIAGSTPEAVLVQEAKVGAAEANVDNFKAQLAKTILKAPIPGIITKQDAKVGEVVTTNANVVSIISQNSFEIEINITETDIAKVKKGNTARITLDAYGSDVVFEGEVASIDPAGTIIEGVATYKTKIYFNNGDERIRSGMTANVDILSASKENVIVIPQRAVFKKNGDKYVEILNKEGKLEERKIETGIMGSEANVEIISGVLEGEKVVNYKNK
jgi:HlyD family secretion protein